jgi:predicted regulator of Ras-like GTPase activity (Roadblock/LC7/MglB family)
VTSASGRDLRRVLDDLCALAQVRGGLVVAPDGLVIAARLPGNESVEALSALGASLGRELELDGARMRRGGFLLAQFRGDGGAILLGATPVGYVMLLADPDADRDRLRQALRAAVESVRRAWTR